jgi:hypothetical protein
MIVTFNTRLGSRYHIDHTNNRFVQELPTFREGPLFNKPNVTIGKPVEIWTTPISGSLGIARVIQTGVVVSREVTLESHLCQP